MKKYKTKTLLPFVLQALYILSDGQANTSIKLQLIFEKVFEITNENENCMGEGSNGKPVFPFLIQQTLQTLKRETKSRGTLAQSTKRGFWELTQEGVQYAQAYKETTSDSSHRPSMNTSETPKQDLAPHVEKEMTENQREGWVLPIVKDPSYHTDPTIVAIASQNALCFGNYKPNKKCSKCLLSANCCDQFYKDLAEVAIRLQQGVSLKPKVRVSATYIKKTHGRTRICMISNEEIQPNEEHYWEKGVGSWKIKHHNDEWYAEAKQKAGIAL